jgi:hypothetical protein
MDALTAFTDRTEFERAATLLVDSLAFLTEKAAPRSRAKRAHAALIGGRAASAKPSPFEKMEPR